MSKDMKVVKFKMVIKEIYEVLGKAALTHELSDDSGKYLNKGYETVWLATIYDYHKLNDYGKIIMAQVCGMTEEDEEDDDEVFSYKMEFVENCQDVEYRMKAAKAIVAMMNSNKLGRSMSVIKALDLTDPFNLYFLFWALMILSVDDTDKEEHLSLICEFAQMLAVSDAALMDLIGLIRVIYNIEGDYKFQTRIVGHSFIRLLEKYEIIDTVCEDLGIERMTLVLG